jgi:hypothetical protein
VTGHPWHKGSSTGENDMTTLPLNEAIAFAAPRIFATVEWLTDRFADAVAKWGYDAALAKFNAEMADMGVQAA